MLLTFPNINKIKYANSTVQINKKFDPLPLQSHLLFLTEAANIRGLGSFHSTHKLHSAKSIPEVLGITIQQSTSIHSAMRDTKGQLSSPTKHSL